VKKYRKKNKNTLKIGNAVNLNVIADRARVLQIILNLLSNACKFTCNGDITVHTTVNTAYLHIIISDTGCGMSENEQQRLFKPFSQANQNINAEYGGTGLGLALSKKLAELMNGGISMQSRVGKGSDFILILPLATS
jgi:signal transduction histidine kinase